MSLIFATQLTAVATAVLSAFAIVTAVLAGLASRKQSAVDLINSSPEPVYNLVVAIVGIQGTLPRTIEGWLEMRDRYRPEQGAPEPIRC